VPALAIAAIPSAPSHSRWSADNAVTRGKRSAVLIRQLLGMQLHRQLQRARRWRTRSVCRA
jgi:hypothetical protein